jgi:preprotein translocase SecE subunit
MFYKWPHGRLIRVIAMIVALVICADIGWNGAWGRFHLYLEGAEQARQGLAAAGNPTQQLIWGCIYATIAVAVLAAGLVLAGVHKRSVEFLIAVEQEMTKVVWPTGSALWRATLIIGITMVVLALGIFLVDLGIYSGLNALYRIGSSF